MRQMALNSLLALARRAHRAQERRLRQPNAAVYPAGDLHQAMCGVWDLRGTTMTHARYPDITCVLAFDVPLAGT